MSRKNLASLQNQQDSDDRQSNSKKSTKQLIKVTSRKKLNLPRPHDSQRHSSYESSSILTSLGRLNDQLEYNKNSTRNYEAGFEILPHFTQKYLPKGSTSHQVYQQMQTIKSFKQSEILTLRVYRDQLKFICYNNHQQAPIKVSIKLLKDKAEIESLMAIQKQQITKQIQQLDTQLKNIKQYTEMVLEYTEEYNQNNQILDIGKQKQIMIENIKTQITHLVKELEDQKRRNAKEIKKIQDNIQDLRIRIKDKQDRIRQLKAKVCTLYIKMHSRNSSRGRSKDRNMSMSVRKFNTNKNETIRQMFIGNVQFKNYSKEIIQKVPENQELLKIKFYIKKDKLHFQCVYDKKQGIIHSSDYEYSSKGEQVPISRNSKNQQTSHQEIFTKYLMSMKFYFKSRIVGVQCRIKTDKGNKHIQIGICQANIEHELVTLVNRKLLTLGSYWHGKQMIGISLWFTEESSHKKLESPKNLQMKNNKNMHSFQEYYT